MLHEETIAFSWESPAFEYKEKSKQWYYIVGGIALIGITLSVILGNYLLAFIILVAGYMMIVLGDKDPHIDMVEISNHGIQVNELKNPYAKIEAFWINRNANNENVLLIHTKRNFNPIESILIHPEVEPLELREYLLEYIEEVEIEEPIAEKIIRKIGF